MTSGWIEDGRPRRKKLTCEQELVLKPVFFSVIDQSDLKQPKKIKSFRSECLKISANEQHCNGEFSYNFEANDRNVSVIKMSQQKLTEMFQRKKKQPGTDESKASQNKLGVVQCMKSWADFIKQ